MPGWLYAVLLVTVPALGHLIDLIINRPTAHKGGAK